MRKLMILLVMCCLVLGGCGKEKEGSSSSSQKSSSEEGNKESETSVSTNTSKESVPTEDSETNLETIAEKDYTVDGKNLKIVISVDTSNGKTQLLASAEADTEEKACLMLTSLDTILKKMSPDNYTAVVKYGELFISCHMSNGDYMVIGINRDGSSSLGLPDWAVEDFTLSEEEMGAYWNETSSAFKDFAETYGGENKSSQIEAVIFQDENVIITYTGMEAKSYGTEYTINLTIENLSEKTLTVQLRETSINGIMVDPMCSIDIAPGKKAMDGAKIWGDEAENIPMGEVKNVETKFHIFNADDWLDMYDTENVVILNSEN